MNITELDSYRLADAVKFHNRLNPALWGKDEHLLPDVRDKLAEIAADFQEFLGIADLDVEDITISGSNAAFSYTPHSDIDLHLVIRKPAGSDEVYQELFNAKKYQYNDMHDIRIRGADVELYVQDADATPVSLGQYSIKNSAWIQVPKKKRAKIDQSVVQHKYQDLVARIDSALKSNDADHIAALITKIKTMRQTGLDQHGEFGPENLAFKILRKQGYIQKLYDTQAAVRDRELSLQEKNKSKQPVRYGFGEGDTGMAQGSSIGDAGAQSTWDGVSPDTDEFLSENQDQETVVQDFIQDTAHRLGIERMPQIELHSDSDWSKNERSFGMYEPEDHVLHVNLANRHLMDILRTTAHELAHCRQHEISPLPDHAGETGSQWENQAHATAGVIMRDYAEAHPDLFESSGYIPTRAQARDPRFKMALTVDIKPGQTGREANKLALKTNAQGKPALLMKTVNLREFKEISNIDNNLSEIDRRGVLKAIGAGALAAAVPGVAQAGPFVDVAALGKSNPEQAQKVWTPRYQELTARCQNIMRRLITAAGPKWAPLLKGTTIRVVSSDNYAQASAISRMIAIDLSVFWDAPDAALAFTIAHELGHIALEHGVGTDDESTDYKTQLRLAAQYRQGELDADEFAVRICKVLGYNKAEVFKFIAQNEAELQMFDALTQSPTSTHPSQKTRIERAKMNGFQLSRGGIEQMNVLKQHLAEHDTVHSDLVENLQQEFALFEDQDLFEINMSPSNLKKLAAQTGALAGMEFEMIVPGVDGGDDSDDLEPDYDQDERCRSIEDAAQFFFDGDFNGRRDIQRLREGMQNDFQEWLDDKIYQEWESRGEEYLEEWIPNNVDESEWNPDNLEGEARTGALEEFIANLHADPGGSDAFDEFQEESDYDESDWLDAEDLDQMSSVERQYEISWPYWSSGGGDEGAGIESVADEFREAIGRKVNWSAEYHGGKREDNTYVVEPDGSLIPDDSDDAGLEFISPKLPINDMISDLNKVKAWADQRGCYTSKAAKTGLHINVSVPGQNNNKLDYVKLTLLLGDEYVLNQFGRLGNSYAASAMGIIKERIAQRPADAAAMLQKMKEGMEELATKIIHSGTTSKFTSINTKSNPVTGDYIEFRSPGGDWLDSNFGLIETTLLRFVVALDAAMDPAKYRDEYLKKLYAVLKPKDQNDTLSYFAKFAAGELPKAALKSFIKQAQLERKDKKSSDDSAYTAIPSSGNQKYEIQRIANDEIVGTFNADSDTDANAVARQWMADNALQRVDFRLVRATGQERAELRTGASNYKIYRMSNGRTMDTFYAADAEQARAEFIDWLMSPAAGGSAMDFNYAPINDRIRGTAPSTPRPRPDIIDIEPDIEQNFVPGSTLDLQRQRQQAAQQSATSGTFTGTWAIKDSQGNTLHTFSGIGNSQADANRVAAGWLARAGYQDGLEVAVVPVMEPS